MIIRGERVHIGQDKKQSFVLEHINRYQFASQWAKNKIVLDLGCGEGYGSEILKDSGARQVIGVDLNQEVINHAIKNYSKKGIAFQQGDTQKLKFGDRSFDLVISFELIEHLKNYRQYLNQVKRVLKPQGVFVLSTPNKDNYRGQTSPFHLKEFSLKEPQKNLEEFFPKVEIFGQRITNPQIITSEKRFFSHYQRLTFQNPLIKKLLLLISPEIKAFFYKKICGQAPCADEKDIQISKENLSQAITFLAVCRL